ncbi:MAG: hypothetical protein CMJ62_03060 [Planctomycetaceae bacterium]|nr:hypothetical protein [Planctomycetaceae bacterium]
MTVEREGDDQGPNRVNNVRAQSRRHVIGFTIRRSGSQPVPNPAATAGRSRWETDDSAGSDLELIHHQPEDDWNFVHPRLQSQFPSSINGQLCGTNVNSTQAAIERTRRLKSSITFPSRSTHQTDRTGSPQSHFKGVGAGRFISYQSMRISK